MEELVSVVIPVYNGEKYLRKAIESVQQQTYRSFEIIVVNDGSTDSSREIVCLAQQNDNRIRLFDQVNSGSAVARNFGINHARGNFIALLDSDDIMLYNRLEVQMDFLKSNPGLAAVSCLAHYINDREEIIGRIYSDLTTPEAGAQYIKDNKIIFCLQSGVIIRKNVVVALGGYRNDLLYGQDTELWNRLVERGYSIVVMPSILVLYRIHEDSSMTHFKRRFQYSDWLVSNIYRRRRGQTEVSFSDFAKELESLPWHRKVSRNFKNYGMHFYRTAGLMYGQKRYIKFAIFLLMAMIMRPSYTFRKLYRQRMGESALR